MRRTVLAGLMVVSSLGFGQSTNAGVVGTLGNFDVVNDTGTTARGFEIDLEGLKSTDITDTFGGAGRYFPPSVERYGSPTITNTATGVSIVYEATFSGNAWNVGTPSGVFNTPGESCWTGGGIGYGPGTPCDHFGVGTSKTPTKTTYSWLTQTAPTSPTLQPVAANLPAPVWTVTPAPPPPPGQPAAPPKVIAQVQAPAPPQNALDPQFGPAEWVKVFTTQYDTPVALEDLLGGNRVVPLSKSETEIEWQLLQTDPGNPLAGMIENGGDAGAKSESVVRSYEFFKYLGTVDPQNGEALQASPILDANGNPVSALNGGNIGNFIGAQYAAVNLNGVFNGLPAAAPEPGSVVVLLTGLSGLLFVRRRQSRT